jgi:two-component system, OmpR family, phosphate regulon sensor histidine kinase PhoR
VTPPEPPDHAALVAGLQTLVERITAGEAGLPALQQLLLAAAAALGAAGMTLTEHHVESGRVVAATGALTWLVGRPVAAGAAPAEPTWEAALDPEADHLSAQLRGRGLRRLVGTRVRRPDGPDGVLCAYFTADEATGAAYRRLLGFIGSCATALYLHAEQLPVAPPPATDDGDLFLAVASHELRTPVTVIKGYADTLDRHWDSWDATARREAVRVIAQRADELAQLVDRLLATTVDSATVLECRPFDLVAALRDAAGGLREELRSRLRVRLPADLPMAHGERATITPVLTELVTNAVRYSSREVGLEADSDEQTVRFRVTDQGVGIAAEDVEQAFARYWRARWDDHGQDLGAGLGLHLVRRIVERQDGWVSLRPRRFGGTVVEVTLLRSDVVKTDMA